MRVTTAFTALAAVAAVLVGAQTGVAGAAPSPARSLAPIAARYVKADPVCAAADRGRATCLALRRVPVPAGTPGARALLASPSYASGPAGGFTPGDLATAYGINAAAPTVVTVGIVDAFDDPRALPDLNTFDARYGLPAETAASFRKVSQRGSTTALPPADPGWATEISLDLDAVRGLCHTCRLLLVEADTNSFTNLGWAEDEAVALGARVITNSYGGAESSQIPANVYGDYDHAGVVITASTGDDGMFDWDGINEYGVSSNAPQFPSSLDSVVAVGGTTLRLNANATRASETVWNENGVADLNGGSRGQAMGASGGGCSTREIAWGWQTSVPGWAQTGCGNKRLAADIAALADPYTGYDIFDSYQAPGWLTMGGTSLASPLVAAMWAVAGGSGGVAYPALSLYGHFRSDPTHPLYDVTAGGNGLCAGEPATACANLFGAPPNTVNRGTLDCAWAARSAVLSAGSRACDAAIGYDGPSGVGTPAGLNAFKPMAPAVRLAVAATITHRVATRLSADAADPFPGGVAVRYDWTFGDGTAATTTAPWVAHTYAATGKKSVTVKVTDSYYRAGVAGALVTVR